MRVLFLLLHMKIKYDEQVFITPYLINFVPVEFVLVVLKLLKAQDEIS